MKYLAYAVAFIVELVVWAALASIGLYGSESRVVGWMLTILIFVTTVVFWSVCMAPKAPYPLSTAGYYLVKFVLYAAAGYIVWQHSQAGALWLLAAVIISEPFAYRHVMTTRGHNTKERKIP